jgi:hypothetical protein
MVNPYYLFAFAIYCVKLGQDDFDEDDEDDDEMDFEEEEDDDEEDDEPRVVEVDEKDIPLKSDAKKVEDKKVICEESFVSLNF